MDETNVEIKTTAVPKTYNLNFFLLVFGRIISGLGGSISGFGVGLYVLDLTGSATAFSLTISMGIIPGVIVNILAGVFVDKHNKKKIMVISDLLCGIVVFLFFMFFLVKPKSLALILAYTFVISIIQSLFMLAINSSIPEFVSNDNVARANSSFQGTGAFISIIGPVIGAIVYKAFGIKLAFIINGVCFLLAGIAEMFLVFEFSRNEASLGEKTKYMDDVKLTFSYLNENRIMAFFFVLATVVNFFYNPLIYIVLPYINYNIIKISGFQLSLLQASVAIGIIIASVIISINKTLGKRLLGQFFTLFMIQAILILLWAFPVLPFFKDKWIITITFCCILILYGAMNISQNIPVFTYFQLKVPVALRARLFGVFSSALYISTPLGMWLYGILLEHTKWSYVTLASGIVLLAVSLVAPYNKYFKEFLALPKD